MITTKLLKSKGACADQIRLFAKLFPAGAPLTVETAVSVADKFNWDWAAEKLLSADGCNAYHAATKPARDAYDAAIKPALDAYYAAIKPARDAYSAARATAFAEIYISENTK